MLCANLPTNIPQVHLCPEDEAIAALGTVAEALSCAQARRPSTSLQLLLGRETQLARSAVQLLRRAWIRHRLHKLCSEFPGQSSECNAAACAAGSIPVQARRHKGRAGLPGVGAGAAAPETGSRGRCRR
jgi:hypothetical protein